MPTRRKWVRLATTITIILTTAWSWIDGSTNVNSGGRRSAQSSDEGIINLTYGRDVAAKVGIPGAREFTAQFPSSDMTPNRWLTVSVSSGDDGFRRFRVESVDVFTPDARIVAMTDEGEKALPRPTIRLYQGFSMTGDGDHLFLGVGGGGTQGFLKSQGDTTLLVPWPYSDIQSHNLVVSASELSRPEWEEYCGADLLPENQEYLSTFGDEKVPEPTGQLLAAEASGREMLEADLMIDVGYALYMYEFYAQTDRIIEYVVNLVGAVSAVYERDAGIRLRISTLTLWKTPDPFNGSDAQEQVLKYRNYVRSKRNDVDRSLAHLLSDQTRFGGLSYYDSLCSSLMGYGVSNLNGNARFPVTGYAWDIDTVAHELGHSFGSVHTHCYSPPIDECYTGERGCYDGPAVSMRGTILSYCHMTRGGIGFEFHPRVSSVMRKRAETAKCLRRIAADDGAGAAMSY